MDVPNEMFYYQSNFCIIYNELVAKMWVYIFERACKILTGNGAASDSAVLTAWRCRGALMIQAGNGIIPPCTVGNASWREQAYWREMGQYKKKQNNSDVEISLLVLLF